MGDVIVMSESYRQRPTTPYQPPERRVDMPAPFAAKNQRASQRQRNHFRICATMYCSEAGQYLKAKQAQEEPTFHACNQYFSGMLHVGRRLIDMLREEEDGDAGSRLSESLRLASEIADRLMHFADGTSLEKTQMLIEVKSSQLLLYANLIEGRPALEDRSQQTPASS